MEWWAILLIVLGAAVVILLAVVLIRTAGFKPKPNVAVDETPVEFDKEKSVANLQALIRCKTVSYYDHTLEDDAEFEKLIGMLPELYPNVFKTCTFQRMEDRGLLFCWKGKTAGDPAVLMAHYDVVPVNESAWSKPPFEAIIEDGVLWGRGALDTKVTFNGILFAANHLMEKGFVPEHDIYFAFSGGEEINGPGAIHIVDWFKAQGITPAFVLDEGGAVVEDVFPGVSQPCGLIGIAEKGMLNAVLTVKSAGGHASAPRPKSPLPELSRAVVAIEDNPPKSHLTKPIAEMFDTLGRHSSFVYRMIFANYWLFGGILDGICKKSGGELNALLRTTTAFTMSSGSAAPNVIPPEASVTINIRINSAETVASTIQYLKDTIKNDRIEISTYSDFDPVRVSRTDNPEWGIVASAVASTWKGCIVSPYLMMQCSDSRNYDVISDKVYRFSAMDLTREERGLIHGNDERIRLETEYRAVEFFIRVITKC